MLRNVIIHKNKEFISKYEVFGSIYSSVFLAFSTLKSTDSLPLIHQRNMDKNAKNNNRNIKYCHICEIILNPPYSENGYWELNFEDPTLERYVYYCKICFKLKNETRKEEEEEKENQN